MQNHSNSNCYIIGDDGLLAQCGDYLLSRHWKIHGVISSSEPVEKWSIKRNLAYFCSLNDWQNHVKNGEFCYLFSISNHTILPVPILDLPKILAINYHNSPLPKYAGVNAPAWSILNAEASHGVSWHVMSNKIDEGDILSQMYFDIDDHDTSLSLNMKCSKYALISFASLLSKLEDNTLKPIKQDLSLRHYFPRYHPPLNYGFIDWNKFSVKAIDSMQRGLTFGRYDNTIGSLKIYFNDTYLILTKSKTVSIQISDLANHSAGTVIDIDQNRMLVALNDGQLEIQSVFYNNHHMSIAEFVNSSAINQGFQFKNMNLNMSTAENNYTSALKSEPFWAKHINAINNFWHEEEVNYAYLRTYKADLLNALAAMSQVKQEIIIATVLAFLGKHTQTNSLPILLRTDETNSLYRASCGLFSRNLPFCFEYNESFSFSEAVNYFSQYLLSQVIGKLMLSDIFYRRSALSQPNAPILINLSQQAVTLDDVDKSIKVIFWIEYQKNRVDILVR